ncbi:hypothetical protein SARC_08114, partial [Sphaeroforma arctica JP610]
MTIRSSLPGAYESQTNYIDVDKNPKMSLAPKTPKGVKNSVSRQSSSSRPSTPLSRRDTETMNPEDAVSVKWHLDEFKQNLVSILNDPMASKVDKDTYYNDWGSAFVNEVCPPSVLPPVTVRDFDKYFGKITERKYHTLKKNRQAMKAATKLREKELAQANDARGPSQNDMKSIAKAVQDVPSIFFTPTFHLEDSQTFKLVFTHAGSEEQDYENEAEQQLSPRGGNHDNHAMDNVSERSRGDESINDDPNGWVESRVC